MKKMINKTSVCCMAILILSAFFINVSAYNLMPYKLTGRVGNWGN